MRVENRRSAEQRDVGGVEVTRVEDRATLEAQEDLAVGEQRILVELQLALHRAGACDADVDTVRSHSV